MQTSYKSSREQRRPRITLGRVVNKKTGTVIIPGVKVIGRLATPHPLHGHLKKVVVVKIPTEGGHFLQRMKLKTALQKGYYSVNATNPKDKAAIEKALEPMKYSGDSHIDYLNGLAKIIKPKTPNA